MKPLRLIAIATAGLLALAGCGITQPERWTAGTGPIKIVASTNVWGSVANSVAGELATVDAIIYNTNQDPHSYELTARDQLLINNADIVIMNGGGYDDFIQTAVDADDTPAILVNAFMAAGVDEDRNEHIWFDVDQTGDVAAVIGSAIESLNQSAFDAIENRVAEFRKQLEVRKLALQELAVKPKNVFLTEPLVSYLIEDAGYLDLTPAEFSQAIEEERDVPALVLAKSMNLIKSGRVDAIYQNENTVTEQVNLLLTADPKVPIFGFSELLPQNEDTLEYGSYFDMLDSAIAELHGK